MSLTNFSAFNYGHNITENNNYIDFSEDGGTTELSATIEIGSYTLTDFIDAVSNAINSAGSQDYTVSLNRTTRKITISATSNFDLLVTSGTHSEISAYDLIGFTVDKSASNTYTGDKGSGFVYEPQFKLQKYVDFEDIVEASDSSVNNSASGIVEVVSYGENKFMECNINYATDIVGQGAIKNNASGVADLRKFMNYIIKKRPIEFLQDIDSPGSPIPCLLERTQSSSNGTGFQLYELYGRGLANYFETKTLAFRKIG